MKGNLTQRVLSTVMSVILLAASALLTVYYLLWQTFVLRVDLVICGILLALQFFQLLFSLIAVAAFAT